MDGIKKKSIFSLVSAVCMAALVSGCAGTEASKFHYHQNYRENVPIKGEECFDAAVLLNTNLDRAREISKKVIAALDATIMEETDTTIKAQRNSHWGVFVGSGGEILTITLKQVDENRTFVTATTKTGFVGAAGMKSWSCRMVDEVVKMASK